MNTSRIDNYIKEQEGLEDLSAQSLQNLQLKKLNELLKREKERGGFYSSLPDRLDKLSDLQALLFTTDEDLADNASSMLLGSQAEIQRVISDATSGTSGKAKRVFYTAYDCESTIGLFVAGLGELVYRGSTVMVCMPFSGPNGLGELICEAIERLGALPLKLGTALSFGEYEVAIKEYNPDCFVGMPVQLLSILRVCSRHSLRRALVSGDACSETVIQECEKLLGSRLFPHYGSREMALGGAVTCPYHKGMHMRDNHVICEIIDDNGNPLPKGEYGQLVITTIGMKALPLIRYKTGDYTRILPGDCPCGSATIRLDSVSRGKEASEILKLDNELFSFEWLVDYRLSYTGRLCFDALILRKVTVATAEAMLKKHLPNDVEINVRYVEAEDKALYSGKRVLIKSLLFKRNASMI